MIFRFLLSEGSDCTYAVCVGGSPWKAHEYYATKGVVTGSDYQNLSIPRPTAWELYPDGSYNDGIGCYPYLLPGEGKDHFNNLNLRNLQCDESACYNGENFDSKRMGSDSLIKHVTMTADEALGMIVSS